MSDAEEKILKIYEGSRADEDELFEVSRVNHLAWTLVVLALGMVVWLAICLVNAENQRNALMNKQCRDPVFKDEVDVACMQVVDSRPHWWNHLWYGMTHLRPAEKK